MKIAILAALAAMASAPAMAQTAAPATAPAAQPQTQAQAKFSVQATPIETMIADPRAKAVLDKHMPGMDQHPAYGQFKNMTLAAVAPYSQGHITETMLKAIQADLDQIK